MKKGIIFIIILGFTLWIGLNRDSIIKFVLDNYAYKYANVTQNSNEYKKQLQISFVRETNNFFPKNRQDLLNIFYTSLNNGVDSFTYYCTSSYQNCLKESEKIASDNNLLSNINNFVHPYNSYSSLSFKLSNFGKVEVNVNKQYTDEEIKAINTKIDEISSLIIKDTMSPNDKIKAIHDFIIEHSSYDQEKANAIVDGKLTQTGNYKSETAYGVLLQGYGICSGFSDAMELFLSKVGIPSYKISSATHMWNLIYIDNKWLHLDLTWDNPVVNGNGKLMLHDFFLIPNSELSKLNTGHHTYDHNIYKEAL